MAHHNKVMQSVNAPDGVTCVDVFMRPDGSFGFEAFRRDPEDPRGWYPIGYHSGGVFTTQEAAWAEAVAVLPWLETV